MKNKLMAHQESAIAFADCNEGLIIGYDVGCGKTMIALEWIHKALKRGEIHNALIVCPASIVGTWVHAIDDCINFEGYSEDDINRLKDAITITSYQKTYRTERKQQRRKSGDFILRKVTLIRENIDKIWDVMVCDECHNLGSHSSIQTKACLTLSRNSRKRIAMSGTPLHGGGGKQDWAKMYGEVQFVTACKQWRNWTHFCDDLVLSYGKWYKPDVWDEEKCLKVFTDYAISCRKEDCVDLPDCTFNDIHCELEEKKMYKDVLKGILEPYELVCDSAGSQYRKLLQIVSGSCKRENDTMALETSKDDALIDLLQSTDDKIIVFCQYRASVDRCMRVGIAAGRNGVYYDGRCSTETWREFTDGDKDLLVIQNDAGSAGLNLQKAHICIFFEPTFSALKLEQAAGRIYRTGQSKKCTYYYFITDNTAEVKIWNLVRSGRDVNNKMLEDLAHGLL